MYVPVVRKIFHNNDVLVERALPAEGHLEAKVGDFVEPFTKMGMTKISYDSLYIGENLKLAKGKTEDGYFYLGDVIGKVGKQTINAPFDGTLHKLESGYELRQAERDFWLLAGLWGQITDIVENKSVLIKTQTLDFSLPVCTPSSHSGEMIVFPNPSELLEMQYLERFAKNVSDKIVYVGNFARLEVIIKSVELGAGGLIAGGADKSSFNYAKQNGMFLGTFSGFGNIPTPNFIFDAIKGITNRYVFVHGDRKVLRIPVKERFEEALVAKGNVRSVLCSLKVGMMVQVLERPYFGHVGVVDSIQDEETYVKLDGAEEIVKVKYPNIIVVE